MIIETDRLCLRVWRISDWTDFRPIATNPSVMRFINGGIPWSDQEIQSFVKRQIELYEEKQYCRWKLSMKGATGIIGFCGVGLWQNAPEVGWWLAPQWWGQGLATEAARATLLDAYQRTDLDRIISVVRPANVASTRVMEKLGLVKASEFMNDGVPLLKYEITRAIFFSQPRNLGVSP
jgi:[ribosomal protein S5]-alanine N-acetyltransferase